MAHYKKRSDGRYEATVYVAGKYKHIYRKTEKELRKAVNELNIQLGLGVDIEAERDTFIDWAKKYLLSRKISVKRGNLTQSRYDIAVRRVDDLEPIHNMQVTKIRTADIQQIIDTKAAGDNPLSVSVLKDIKAVAKHTLQLAVDNRVILYNPADAVKVEADKHKEPVRRALTSEEQAWINAPSDNRGHVAAMIMMHAGLRRGELIPLLWSDIDLTAGTISVNKTVMYNANQPTLKDYGKTDNAIRKVYIPTQLADFLRQTKSSSKSVFVCPSAKGSMMTVTAYRKMWESYMWDLNHDYGNFDNVLIVGKDGELQKFDKHKKYAPKSIPRVIPNITAHWLRHTFITNMYFAGLDLLTAKEQAGHSDVKTTLDIYTHLDKDHKQKEIDKLSEYLDKKAQ